MNENKPDRLVIVLLVLSIIGLAMVATLIAHGINSRPSVIKTTEIVNNYITNEVIKEVKVTNEQIIRGEKMMVCLSEPEDDKLICYKDRK